MPSRSERSWIQKAPHCRIPFIPHSGNGKTRGRESTSVVARGCRWGGRGVYTRDAVMELLGVIAISAVTDLLCILVVVIPLPSLTEQYT